MARPVTFTALYLAIILSGPAFAQNYKHGEMPFTAPIVVGGPACEQHLDPMVENNGFEIGRDIKDYDSILPTTKELNVRSLHRDIGPKGVTFDISAGFARTLLNLEYNGERQLFAASYKMPVVGAQPENLKSDQIEAYQKQYNIFHQLQWRMRPETIVYYEVDWDKATAEQLIKAGVPNADFLLDIIGYLQYSRNFSYALKLITELTNKNGYIAAAFIEKMLYMPLARDPYMTKYLEIIDEDGNPVSIKDYFDAITGLEALAVNPMARTPGRGQADELGFSGIWRKTEDQVQVPDLELIEYKLQKDDLVYRKYRWNRKKNKMVAHIPLNLPKYVDKRRVFPRPPP